MPTQDNTLEVLQTIESKNREDENDVLSFRLAHDTKSVRQNHIAKGSDSQECLISAAIEISRVWRGYRCRYVHCIA